MDPRNFQYMFYGFAAAWIIIAAYGLSLLVRERKIDAELKRLKNMIDDREKR
ncbi:MAG: CcmD family protein [Bryobacteraceae bacterium]